jgi:hypothetical protein
MSFKMVGVGPSNFQSPSDQNSQASGMKQETLLSNIPYIPIHFK